MNYNSNTFILSLVLLCFIYCIYRINKLENRENFTTATTEQQITAAVKRIYLADVEAIRLLSNFAIQLSQGGTTIPGNVSFSGNTTIGGNILLNNKPGTQIIDFGAGDASREGNAGKIAYGLFDALDIVGKGTSNTNRKVHLWDATSSIKLDIS